MRTLFTMVLAAGVSAWAAAQAPPPGPTAADQLRLLQGNRGLVEELIARGVAVSDAGSPLDRADECRRAAGALADALRGADSPDRVAELTDYFGDVVENGLAPVLTDVRKTTAAGSPGEADLKRVEKQVGDELGKAAGAIPAGPEYEAARRRLAGAEQKVSRPGGK